MKKNLTYLFAAIVAVSAAVSCAKEEFLGDSCISREITVSYLDTKTELNDGQTVWAEGDSLWFSNGTQSQTIVVPAEAYGKKEFSFFCNFSGPLYVVYPYSAATKTVTGGKPGIRIPNVQSGLFKDANICVGYSETTNIQLKNATAILKVRADEGTQNILVDAGDDVVSGVFNVDASGDAPALTATTQSHVITVYPKGVPGEVTYVAVAPGTYAAGFSVSAITAGLGSYGTKTTTQTNTVAANQMVDLGEIDCTEFTLEGSGTESDPFQIGNLAEWVYFAYDVNSGNTYDGLYVKATADIKNINIPAGYYVSGSDCPYFSGSFDGDNHTLTIDMDATYHPAPSYTGLFGYAKEGVEFKNLTIEGKLVSPSGNSVAALVSCLRGTAAQVSHVTNVTNKANVTAAGTHVAGLIGYTDYVEVENCKNEGSIKGSSNNGGIVGYVNTVTKIKNCSNSGSVGGGSQTGGIVGYSYQGIYIDDCSNSGTITGGNQAAGIIGCATWGSNRLQDSYVKNCVNDGDVTGTDRAAGIAGQAYYLKAIHCTNNGTVNASQTTGSSYTSAHAGGIFAYTQNANIDYCVNNGAISGKCSVGGLMGYKYWTSANHSVNHGSITGKFYVGGLVGASSKGGDLRNSYNDGKVHATGSASATADVSVGGLIGFGRNQDNAVTIYNCYNNGEVVYDAQVKDCRAGGLVGGMYASGNWGIIRSAYNSGKVHQADDAPVEGAEEGALFGKLITSQLVQSVFYLEGTNARAFGPGTTSGVKIYSAFSGDDGSFPEDAEIEIAGEPIMDVVEALNAELNTFSNPAIWYKYEWKNGKPVFIIPAE